MAISSNTLRTVFFARLPLRPPTLGWLRVLLALLVMQFHYGFDAILLSRMLIEHPDWKQHLQYIGSGNLSVVGFFVISGYLVASVVSKRYDPARPEDFLHFSLSRYLRIFPLYMVIFLLFCVVAACIVHVPVAPDASTFFSRWLLLPTALGQIWPSSTLPLYGRMVPEFWGAAWTLPFDILFYPLGFLLLRDRRSILALLGVLMISQMGLGVLYAQPVAHPIGPFDNLWNLHAYATLSFCLTAFVAGMAAQLWLGAWKRPLIAAGASGFAMLLLMFFPWNIPPGIAACLSVLVFAIFVHALAQKGSDPQEANLGHYTYAVYLLHQFLGSVPLTLVAAYWVGVRFEGGPIARFRTWAERASRQALDRSEAMRHLRISPWMIAPVFIMVAVNLLFLFKTALAA